MTADDTSPTPSEQEPDTEPGTELVVRLRARAAELRATAPTPRTAVPTDEPSDEPELELELEPEPAPASVPEPEPVEGPGVDDVDDDDDDDDVFAGAPHGGYEDPEQRDLMNRWADEEHYEAVSPRRNWTPLVVVVFALAVVALIAVAFRAVTADDATDATGVRGGVDADAPSVLDEDAPTLDDLTADVTIPPGPAEGLSVVDKGVTVVEDRFDAQRREGTFAVILDNPHPGWLAQSVQVEVDFLDEQGATVGTDTAFIEVILPDQRVAVASHFFDAPTVPVVDLAVRLDVARWRETDSFDGELTTAEVTTEEAEFSGLRTAFTLRSSFDRPLSDVGITVVYRGVFGQIVGGYDTFVDLLEPGVDTPAEIALLANIPLEAVSSTELYPYAGFGFVPDE